MATNSPEKFELIIPDKMPKALVPTFFIDVSAKRINLNFFIYQTLKWNYVRMFIRDVDGTFVLQQCNASDEGSALLGPNGEVYRMSVVNRLFLAGFDMAHTYIGERRSKGTIVFQRDRKQPKYGLDTRKRGRDPEDIFRRRIAATHEKISEIRRGRIDYANSQIPKSLALLLTGDSPPETGKVRRNHRPYAPGHRRDSSHHQDVPGGLRDPKDGAATQE